MEDFLLMHVSDALQDLLHVVHTGELCVLKVVVHDALKQLTASNTATQTNHSKKRERERERMYSSTFQGVVF